MVLSRRDDSDYLQHHQVFLDWRDSSWAGDWEDGAAVAVMYMGGGGDSTSCWAYTDELAAGEWSQITFTIVDGLICGYVNGARSGECSDANGGTGAIVDGNRQMGTGSPLEIGGEDSYSNHPLWSMASILYYSRALSDDEVRANYATSQCIEMGVDTDVCPSDYIYNAGSSLAPINCLTVCCRPPLNRGAAIPIAVC